LGVGVGVGLLFSADSGIEYRGVGGFFTPQEIEPKVIDTRVKNKSECFTI
jgi:hypothetical protein